MEDGNITDGKSTQGESSAGTPNSQITTTDSSLQPKTTVNNQDVPANNTKPTETAAMIIVLCPQCGTQNKVEPRMAGTPIACRLCAYTFVFTPSYYGPVLIQQQPMHTTPVQYSPQTYPVPPPPVQSYQAQTQYTTPNPISQQPNPYQVQYYPSHPQYSSQPQYPTSPNYPVYPYQPYPNQPYTTPYPPAPQKQSYSWEYYPGFYRETKRERKPPAKSEIGAMTMLLFIAAALSLLSAGISAAAPSILEFGGTHELRGTIIQSGFLGIDNNPLEGVTVILDNGTSYITDSQGAFYFKSVSDGDHTIRAVRSGFYTVIVQVFVIKIISDNVEISMEPSSGDGGNPIYEDKRAFKEWSEAYASFYSQALIITVFSTFIFAGAFCARGQIYFSFAAVGGGLALGLLIFYTQGFLALNLLLLAGVAAGAVALALVLRNRHFFKNYNN